MKLGLLNSLTLGGVLSSALTAFPDNVYLTNGSTDYISLPFSRDDFSAGKITFKISSNDTKGVLIGDDSAGFLGAFDQGGSQTSLDGGFGSPVYTIDGVLFTGTRRSELYAAIFNGSPREVEISNITGDGASADIRMMYLTSSSQFRTAAKVSDVRVDLNGNGTLDARYTFTEGAGDIAFDSTGNGNHGFIVSTDLATLHTTDSDMQISGSASGFANVKYYNGSTALSEIATGSAQGASTFRVKFIASDTDQGPSASAFRLFGSDDSRSNNNEIRTFGGTGTNISFFVEGGWFVNINSESLSDFTEYEFVASVFQEGATARGKSWIDGTEQTDDTSTRTLSHSNTSLSIASWNGGYFGGYITDFEYYDEGLEYAAVAGATPTYTLDDATDTNVETAFIPVSAL